MTDATPDRSPRPRPAPRRVEAPPQPETPLLDSTAVPDVVPEAVPDAVPVSPPGAVRKHTAAEVAGSYRSTVVAPMQILLGVLSGVVIAVILEFLDTGLWPIAIVLFLAAAATGWYLSPVSVDIVGRRVIVGQGRRERDPLVIYLGEIREAELRDVTFAQCLGFGGVESDDRTTRLAVRPGATLVLTQHNGERLLVSVADGPAALRAVTAV